MNSDDVKTSIGWHANVRQQGRLRQAGASSTVLGGRTGLFPAVDSFADFMLEVGAGHSLRVEISGNPQGIPVLVLHGGPGGGASPHARRFLDPHMWRIIQMDQRGAGRSLPRGELADNTTWHLVADIEALRIHLGIEEWSLLGGSWGTTLALTYASQYPARVQAMVLRGVFLGTRAEVQWFYQEGANRLYPDRWDQFVALLTPQERGDVVKAYQARLANPDRRQRLPAARAWARWEGETTAPGGPANLPDRYFDDHFVDAFARIENHYFAHDCFMPHDGWLLEQIPALAHIPTWMVQGRQDVCTPLAAAWAVRQAAPDWHLRIVETAGHTSQDGPVVDALCDAIAAMGRELTGSRESAV